MLRGGDTDIDEEILGERPEGSQEVSHRVPRISAVPEQGTATASLLGSACKVRRERVMEGITDKGRSYSAW